MSRSPNSEQKLAIEHSGGVSLSAGAGSGKTFVLVEHVFFLTMNKLKEFSSENIEVQELELRKLYSTIVLMTFTNKAAGEISIRLYKRFEELDGQTYEVIKKSLGYLTVTTIHGFCFKLIQRGYFDHLGEAHEILSEEKFKNKISLLLRDWYKESRESLSPEISEIFLSHQKNLEESFFQVFSGPEIRKEWEYFQKEETFSGGHEEVLSKTLALLEIDDIFEKTSSALQELRELKSAKWTEYLNEQGNLILKEIPLIDKLVELYNFYKSNRRASVPKGGSESLKEYAEQTKKLQKFCVDYYDDLNNLREIGEEHILKWLETVRHIFNYCSKNYFVIKGLTFSDLEYYVDEGLNDPKTLTRVQKDFSYLIVDEFQDTSRNQFSIIRKIIGNDFLKLFCVGDIKQAIYGFRGGEIGVFEECIRLTPQKLSLLNNYRSKEKIIQFNNQFFDFLFPLGEKYTLIDKFSVELEHQNVPLDMTEKGSVNLQKLDLVHEDKKSLNQTELNYIESQLIADYLSQLKEQGELSDKNGVCILYKNLTPLKFLIQMLIKIPSLSFTCQAKILLAEDPILAFFQICLEYSFERDEDGALNHAYYETVVEQIFTKLSLSKISANQLLERFYQDYKNLGVRFSFINLMSTYGIGNSGQENNLLKVLDICDYCQEKKDVIYLELQKIKQKNYSIEFQKGLNPKEIQIMTTHASKGLEFSEVILAGIHTNGSSRGDSLFFGCHPRSFKWMQGGNKKNIFKTPEFIHEEILTKKKNFSETKRLFYVATTRAVDKLTWFDISLNGKEQSFSDNSWVVGLRKYLDSTTGSQTLVTYSHVKTFQNPFEVQTDLDTLQPPLFHNDNLGISPSYQEELLLFCESSVTRLAGLAECPRKFYLKNILKLELETQEVSFVENEVDFVSDRKDKVHSTSERGTYIHESLSKVIKSSFTQNLDSFDYYREEIDWTLTQVKPYFQQNFKLHSEQEWKFELFGQMISGTPDLIIENEEKVEVWDFKTGKRNEVKDQSYWFQLKCYAYACFQKFSLDKNQTIVMKLIFIDLKVVDQITMTYDEIRMDLFSLWKNQNRVDLIEPLACSHCQYQQLCKKKESSCKALGL